MQSLDTIIEDTKQVAEKKTQNQVSCEKSKWQTYLTKARSNGMSISFVVRTLLEMWNKGLELEIVNHPEQ